MQVDPAAQTVGPVYPIPPHCPYFATVAPPVGAETGTLVVGFETGGDDTGAAPEELPAGVPQTESGIMPFCSNHCSKRPAIFTCPATVGCELLVRNFDVQYFPSQSKK